MGVTGHTEGFCLVLSPHILADGSEVGLGPALSDWSSGPRGNQTGSAIRGSNQKRQSSFRLVGDVQDRHHLDEVIGWLGMSGDGRVWKKKLG